MPFRTTLDEAAAWALLLELADRARAGQPLASGQGVCLSEDGKLVETAAPSDAWILVRSEMDRGWAWPTGEHSASASPSVAQLFDLYMPVALGNGTRSGALTVAHLAQTLDGRIAIASGKSQFITGDENLRHAHRLRALCDAVVVGWRTVQEDNPQLTTRLCEGPHPTRVVIDPWRRLSTEHRLFEDESSPTLLVTARSHAASARHGHAAVVPIDPVDRGLPIAAIVDALATRGLRRLYVEGGGVTVSRFLAARALDRLHVAVAPTVFGSGIPSFSLPAIDSLEQSVGLEWRPFLIGRDVLFDCTVRR